MNAADNDLKEIMEAYRLTSPSIKVFRRGTMADYRGPHDAVGIAEYIRGDSQPSIHSLATFDEVKLALKNRVHAVVLGFFPTAEVSDEGSDGYSMDAWGQYQAAADSLRGYLPMLFQFMYSKDVLPIKFNCLDTPHFM